MAAAPKKAAPEAEKPTDSGESEVTATIDAENEKGLRGVEVDQTPNSAYTVAGVIAGEPTPETDADAKAKALG